MVKTRNINTQLLNEAIDNSGLRVSYIIDQLGISRQAFDRKRKGAAAFRQSEVFVLCSLLDINDERRALIFFP